MIAASDLFEPRRTRALALVERGRCLSWPAHVCGAALAMMHWQVDDTPDPADGAVAIELAPMPLSPRLDMPDLAHGPLMEEAKLTPQAAKEVKEEIEKELPRIEPSPLAPETASRLADPEAGRRQEAGAGPGPGGSANPA